ncbi:MFS transporter [Saliniramus sp.]|uniref:MFS transporter n=1 Tax=Saliniramus sp. TaxID=2986772 RepID=UPI002BF624C1|nr:MFS transporter [Saliniramus sp.]HMB12072.1 MFS transporter [Saliniramus sp.]
MMIFATLLFAYTLSQFFRAFLAIVSVDLSRDLALDSAQLGAVSAIWFAAFALAQFPVGYALDRYGPRRTIAATMIFAVIGCGLMATATGFYSALTAMAAIGVGCSAILMGSLFLFARNHAAEKFAMFTSLFVGLGALGNLLGTTPLALAVELFGWRWSMVGITAITALSTLLAFLVLRDPERIDSSDGSGGMIAGLAEIVSLRTLWLILPITFVSYAVVIATRSLWIAPFFSQVHGYSVTATGNAALLMAITMSIGALAYGPLERFIRDTKRTAVIGSAVTAGAYLALAGFGAKSAAASVALIGLIGAAGLTYGIIMAHARLFFPRHLIGRGVTFMNFVFISGAGIIQWISGQFINASERAGLDAGERYATLYGAFGLLVAAALALYLFAPARPKPQATHQAAML